MATWCDLLPPPHATDTPSKRPSTLCVVYRYITKPWHVLYFTPPCEYKSWDLRDRLPLLPCPGLGSGARSFLSCIRGPSLRHHGEYCIVVAIFSETMEHGVDASTFHTGNTDRTVLSIMALQPRSPSRNNHQAQHRDGTKRQILGLGGTGKEWLTTSAEQRPD